jgi:hypothetical protein
VIDGCKRYREEMMITTVEPFNPAHVCSHTPPCPSAAQVDREAAHVVAAHPEQGWSLLCNGVVLFEDTGELLPDGQSVAARRSDLLACASHRGE